MYQLLITDRYDEESVISMFFNKFTNSIEAAEEIAHRADKNGDFFWVLRDNMCYIMNAEFKFEITHLIGWQDTDGIEITDENPQWRKCI